MMLLASLNPRAATAVRIVGIGLICWSLAGASHAPAGSGRGLVVALALAVCVACWLPWVLRPEEDRHSVTPELYVMAAAGGVLLGATPESAASAFVFVAVVTAAMRVELSRALPVAAGGVGAAAVTTLLYADSGLGLLAYTLGFSAAMLIASNRREVRARAEQAELLLAQTQRSREEELRAARLEESTRIAREIHDVLAHTLAGLAIQLEATASLLEQGAERDGVLARVRRAHELAREGLVETRRAVGALRGEAVSAPAGIETLLTDYRTSVGAPAELTIDGDAGRLRGATGEAVLRVVQEALTNVRKHAPGAAVSVEVHAGAAGSEEALVVRVQDRRPAGAPDRRSDGIAASGGGYGLRGMSERAELLGGTIQTGATPEGWRVELRLPAPSLGVAPGRHAG